MGGIEPLPGNQWHIEAHKDLGRDRDHEAGGHQMYRTHTRTERSACMSVYAWGRTHTHTHLRVQFLLVPTRVSPRHSPYTLVPTRPAQGPRLGVWLRPGIHDQSAGHAHAHALTQTHEPRRISGVTHCGRWDSDVLLEGLEKRHDAAERRAARMGTKVVKTRRQQRQHTDRRNASHTQTVAVDLSRQRCTRTVSEMRFARGNA